MQFALLFLRHILVSSAWSIIVDKSFMQRRNNKGLNFLMNFLCNISISREFITYSSSLFRQRVGEHGLMNIIYLSCAMSDYTFTLFQFKHDRSSQIWYMSCSLNKKKAWYGREWTLFTIWQITTQKPQRIPPDSIQFQLSEQNMMIDHVESLLKSIRYVDRILFSELNDS